MPDFTTQGVLHSINISNGGVPKLPTWSAEITTIGLLGDKQRNQKLHGGPLKAVCLFSWEIITALQNQGHSLQAGSLGENLTIKGLAWELAIPGKQLHIGDVTLKIESFAPPCKTIAHFFINKNYHPISPEHQPGHCRVYASVVKTGSVYLGDKVLLQNI